LTCSKSSILIKTSLNHKAIDNFIANLGVPVRITSHKKSSGMMFAAFASVILFSSVFAGTAYGAISLDKGTYTWTDKVHIRVTEHGLDLDGTSVRISTSDPHLNNYKMSKAGN